MNYSWHDKTPINQVVTVYQMLLRYYRMDTFLSNRMTTQVKPRVIFFGMLGNFSRLVFSALLARKIEICAVVLPATPIPGLAPLPIRRREPPQTLRSLRFSLPLVGSGSPQELLHMAWERRIAVWEVSRLAHAETIAVLSAYQADMICVACFSQRIPRVILILPRLGCLNVHPSLLPAHRGPVPLFWAFYEGDEVTGVTVHFMDEGLDSGPILAQERIVIPDGISYAELEMRCATQGGASLAQTVWDMYDGNAHSSPQDEALSSYHPFPAHEDFIVQPATWSARHVYNFIRGIGHWDEPIVLRSSEGQLTVRDAISYSLDDTNTRTFSSEQQVIYEAGKRAYVRCRDGWVHVRVIERES
jgi:methionyl-tRNA formyltransferase